MIIHLANSIYGFEIVKSYYGSEGIEKKEIEDDYFMSFLRMSKTKNNDPAQGFYMGEYNSRKFFGRCSLTKFQKRPFEVVTVLELEESDFDRNTDFIQYVEYFHLTHLLIFSNIPKNLNKEDLKSKIVQKISKFNPSLCINQFGNLMKKQDKELAFFHPYEVNLVLDQFSKGMSYIKIGENKEKPYKVYGKKIGVEWFTLLNVSSSINLSNWVQNLKRKIVTDDEINAFRFQWNIPYEMIDSDISDNVTGNIVDFLRFLERFFDLTYLSTCWNKNTNSLFHEYYQTWLAAVNCLKSSTS